MNCRLRIRNQGLVQTNITHINCQIKIKISRQLLVNTNLQIVNMTENAIQLTKSCTTRTSDSQVFKMLRNIPQEKFSAKSPSVETDAKLAIFQWPYFQETERYKLIERINSIGVTLM